MDCPKPVIFVYNNYKTILTAMRVNSSQAWLAQASQGIKIR